jgi:hypothetical protein
MREYHFLAPPGRFPEGQGLGSGSRARPDRQQALTWPFFRCLYLRLQHLRLSRVLELTRPAAGVAAMGVKPNQAPKGTWVVLISILAYAAICGMVLMV